MYSTLFNSNLNPILISPQFNLDFTETLHEIKIHIRFFQMYSTLLNSNLNPICLDYNVIDNQDLN